MHRRESRWPLAVWMTVAMLVASACTSSDGRPDAKFRTDSSPRGGTLRAAVPDGFPLLDMDPQRAWGVPEFELDRCCLLRTLYSYNGKPTEEGGAQLRPDLAAGPAEVSADGLTWTFRLRQGLRYAPPFDDTSITALDLVRALERSARIGSDSGDLYLGVIRGYEDYGSGSADSIVGLETPDDRTLVVRLDRVTGDLGYRFALPTTAPIPEGAAEGHDLDYARYLVASGPYMIEGSDRLDFSAAPREQEPVSGYVPPVVGDDGAVEVPGSLVLVRNPSWDAGSDRLRAAYPDRIELAIGGSDDQEIARRVDSGQLDMVFGPSAPFEQVSRYRDDPALEDRLLVRPNDSMFSVTMNLAVPPFDDVHVRRAVSFAIDKDSLIELLNEPPFGPFGFSYGEVATHVAPDTLEGRLLRAFDPYPYDPTAARAEMRASAYDRTGDGGCDASACRHVRVLVMDAGVLPDQARAIRGDLAELGIDLDLQIRSPADFFGDEEAGGTLAGSIHDPLAQNAMGIAYPWGQDYPEGGGWFSPLFDRSGLAGPNTSLLGATPEELGDWGYEVTSVPAVDDRVQTCLGLRGVARIHCWAEFDQYLSTEVVPEVPYFSMETALVVSERVVAYSFDQFTGLPALDRVALASGSD